MEQQPQRTRGQGCAAAAAAGARRAITPIGTAGLAENRVVTKVRRHGVFGCVELAQNDRALGLLALDDQMVVIGHIILERLGSKGRAQALGRKAVLHADRETVQDAPGCAIGARRIGRRLHRPGQGIARIGQGRIDRYDLIERSEGDIELIEGALLRLVRLVVAPQGVVCSLHTIHQALTTGEACPLRQKRRFLVLGQSSVMDLFYLKAEQSGPPSEFPLVTLQCLKL